MSRSMNTAISGMLADQTKLDVIANNITNSSTTAFKTSKVNFSDTLYQETQSASGPSTNTGGINGKSIGLGSQVSGIDKIMTTGNMEATQRTLDLMVNGNGYFITTEGQTGDSLVVNATHGLGAATGVNNTYYTRDGNLKVDKDGNLITSKGYRVMGYYATGISSTLAGGIDTTTVAVKDASTTAYTNAALTALIIPKSVKVGSGTEEVSGCAISTDGTITVTTASGTYPVGQIAMANFVNPEGLKDLGGNYVQPTTNSGDPVIKSSKTLLSGSTDNSGTFGPINSGYLEASNVDLTTEFASMITTTKAFQAASKMITNGGELLDTIVGLVR